MTVPILTRSLLAEFEARLRAQNVPAIEAAAPGLTESEMVGIVAPIGLSLPQEAQAWWAWHNGVNRDAGMLSREIGPGREWLPLEEAAEEGRRVRETMAAVAQRDGLNAADLWSPTWLPIVQYDGLYIIDTGGARDEACPVRIHWFDEPAAPNDLRSLGELIELWIEAIDRRVWRFEGRRWAADSELQASCPMAKRGLI